MVAATLTGSEGAGRSVAEIAGHEIKKTVLELGGSDAFVVMPSADLDSAVKTAVTSRTQNNGQSCISAKRFIVHADIADAFREKFVAAMSALVVGDPLEEGTDVGPLATEQGRADVEELVDGAVKAGATVLCGGQRPDRPGWFYPPTVHHGHHAGHADLRRRGVRAGRAVVRGAGCGRGDRAGQRDAVRVELQRVDHDADEQARFIDGLSAGGVFINGMTVSYPELPFGGVKASGYGRELSALGIREFCNAKTVWIG